MGVNAHQAFDEKPGIKVVWPNIIMIMTLMTLSLFIMVKFN